MIIAVDQFESKVAMAKRFGATHTIDASNTDAVEAIHKLTAEGPEEAPVVEGLGPSGGLITPSRRSVLPSWQSNASSASSPAAPRRSSE